MCSNSVDAGFVLALPFYHGDLEPDCVGASTRGAYARDGNTLNLAIVSDTNGKTIQIMA